MNASPASNRHDRTLMVLLSFAALGIMVTIGLLRGPDVNWDLRNYHYFNGFSHWYGGFDRHLFPAQFQSWHNATIDEFIVVMMRNLPPKMVAVVLAALQSLNAPLLFLIATQMMDSNSLMPIDKRRAVILAAAVLIGMTGAMEVSEIATTLSDNVATIPFLIGLLCLGHVYWLEKGPVHGSRRAVIVSLVTGGFAVGLACGWKLTMVTYLPGLALCLLWLGSPKEIIKRGFIFGLSAGAGIAVGEGAWAWHLWQVYSSPVFPIMNGVFKSPWLDPVSFFDDRFRPKSFIDALLFPFLTMIGRHPGAELYFRDPRFAIMLILLPVALFKMSRSWAGAVLTFFYVSAAIWMLRFGIQRFALPLEMLCGPLILYLVGTIAPQKHRTSVLVILTGCIMLSTRAPDWQHGTWLSTGPSGNWFAVDVPSDLQKSNEMFLMLDDYPSSYVIPFFPEDSRFERMEGNLNPSPGTLLYEERKHLIAQNQGPIYSYGPHDPTTAQLDELARYKLKRNSKACIELLTNIEALKVCPLERTE